MRGCQTRFGFAKETSSKVNLIGTSRGRNAKYEGSG